MQLREIERTPVRFSAEHYLRLDIDERTELLGGVIYRVSPRNEPHSFAEYYATPDDLALPHGRIATESETIAILGVSIPVAGLFGDRKP